MSFREKSTWISFLLTLVGFGFYFVSVLRQLIWPVHPHRNFFMLFVALLLLIIVLNVVLHAIAAARAPADARTPQDERERMISLKAKRPAFYVVMTGSFLSVGIIHLNVGPWPIINAVLFSVWLGQLTNYGAQLYYYRRET